MDVHEYHSTMKLQDYLVMFKPAVFLQNKETIDLSSKFTDRFQMLLL